MLKSCPPAQAQCYSLSSIELHKVPTAPPAACEKTRSTTQSETIGTPSSKPTVYLDSSNSEAINGQTSSGLIEMVESTW